jgi:hypothetical protein
MKSLINKISATITLASIATSAFATDEAFTSSMTLLAPIVITETSALTFANAVSGQASTVTSSASSANAAQFTATGEASTAVTGSIVEANITMTTGDGIGSTKQITVDSFTTGGDMDGSGAATFDGSGNLSNLRVGATANVLAEDIAGAYTGTATFRLVYQ